MLNMQIFRRPRTLKHQLMNVCMRCSISLSRNAVTSASVGSPSSTPASTSTTTTTTTSDIPPVITSAPPPPPKNVSILDLLKFRRKGKKISMVTAYDFPSAVHADKANIDVVLVGDSVGMVEMGYDTTLPVTMDDMLHHCRAVSRGCRRPLLVGDMPFGSFESSLPDAIRNAQRLLKEGSMDCVKIEGGRKRAHIVESVIDAGVAVMGHIGLTPQSFSTIGGFRSQGRDAAAALALVEDALAIEAAGAFAIVIECVPVAVAKAVTEAVSIPTIGIGAGPHTSGQVLVYHDLLGMMQHHHHGKVTPKFCKQYAQVGVAIQAGLEAYRDDVLSGNFPSDEFSPYKIPKVELDIFEDEIEATVESFRLRNKSNRDGTSADMSDDSTSLYGSKT